MTRIPLLAGTRVNFLDAPEGAVLVRPPAPASRIDDVRAAVRDALRFPLAGPLDRQRGRFVIRTKYWERTRLTSSINSSNVYQT